MLLPIPPRPRTLRALRVYSPRSHRTSPPPGLDTVFRTASPPPGAPRGEFPRSRHIALRRGVRCSARPCALRALHLRFLMRYYPPYPISPLYPLSIPPLSAASTHWLRFPHQRPEGARPCGTPYRAHGGARCGDARAVSSRGAPGGCGPVVPPALRRFYVLRHICL